MSLEANLLALEVVIFSTIYSSSHSIYAFHST